MTTARKAMEGGGDAAAATGDKAARTRGGRVQAGAGEEKRPRPRKEARTVADAGGASGKHKRAASAAASKKEGTAATRGRSGKPAAGAEKLAGKPVAAQAASGWPPGYEPRPPQQAMHEGMQGRRFAVIVAHRRMGKTVAVLNHLIKAAQENTRERPFYAYVAPYTHQAKAVAWGYLKAYTAHLERRKVRETELAVELDGGAKIRLFGADNPDSLRGLYFDGVVMDEFAMMKREAWLSVIRPALSDREGFAVFIGTPAGHNAFHDVYRAALADPAWYAAMFSAEDTGVLPGEELESAKRQMSENRYRQEYLCDFEVSGEDVLIPLTLLNAAMGRKTAARGAALVMGVDVGLSLGGDPTAVVLRQGGLVTGLTEFRLDETLAVAGRVRELAAEKNPAVIVVDAIGWGAGVAHVLSGWGLPVRSVNVAESPAERSRFARLRDELWWRTREFFAAKSCVIDQRQDLAGKLIAELSTPSYGYTPEGQVKIESKQELKKRGQASPNLADALALTMVEPRPHGDQPVLIEDKTKKRSRIV